jgi:proline iminopeptidase
MVGLPTLRRRQRHLHRAADPRAGDRPAPGAGRPQLASDPDRQQRQPTQRAGDGRPPRQPRRSLTGRKLATRAWTLLRLPLAVVTAAIAGLLALVGTAGVSARPTVFLGTGLAVFVAATAAGIALVTRKLAGDRRRRTRLVAVAAGVLAGVAVFGATALVPVRDPRLFPAPVAGQRYWELSTGSRIAWVHLPARGTPRPTPVVFLHGGPGVADMAGDAAYFGQLTQDGFDVWVYDQVGTGRSSRLADPRQYTVARGVADLEAIRQRIGADRMVLVGHSWGGQVAAGYLAAHPQHVARVVFSSPGPLAPALDDGSDAGVRGRLTTGQQLGLYRLLARPRVLLGYTLLQVNPRAAYAFVGDAEMDARNDRVYNHGRAGAHCRGASPGPELHGLGFYAYQFPQSAAARPWADPRPVLARLATPALVVKGSCDYLSWASGVDYWQALPNAELVYLHRAGHNAYQDQPGAFLAVVRAFLTGRPLPIAPQSGSGLPADYEGPEGHPPVPGRR